MWREIDPVAGGMLTLQVRNHLRNIYQKNKELFDNPKTYISHFGPVGKSGGLILNQFIRCYPSKLIKLIPSTTIFELTDDCNIIFLDDFIGSGIQAIEYIRTINGLINASTKPYLFTVAATEDGLNRIRLFNSRFQVQTSLLLDNKQLYLLDPESNVLDESEKRHIISLNTKLGVTEKNNFHLGIPFSFYYSTPDNSLGILWNDGTKYKDSNNNEREWYGLIPREY